MQQNQIDKALQAVTKMKARIEAIKNDKIFASKAPFRSPSVDEDLSIEQHQTGVSELESN